MSELVNDALKEKISSLHLEKDTIRARARTGELWNALHDATDLLEYYINQACGKGDCGETRYHKHQLRTFNIILWGHGFKKAKKEIEDAK
jgi:hypothetical protein